MTNTDIFTDASDPKQVSRKIKSDKSKELVAREGLRHAMSTEQGRAWLYRVLMWCEPFRSPFSIDALQMAKNCGEVNIGLQIIADMHEVSPELYLQTIKENQNG